MKKLSIFVYAIIFLSLFSYAANINECKTDIYYGNGVWNEYEDADDSRDKLEKRIIELEIIDGDTALKAKYGKVKLAYNWGQGRLLDVLETYYQLREAGQLDGVGFYTAIAALTIELPHITLSAIAVQKLMEPFTKDWEQGNVDEMWQTYYRESFKLGHRVLLVSHSQGNLFANRIFDTIDPTEYKKYFANVQVASPASKVKADEVGKGAHVTLWGDPIINPIPGSMSPNAQGSPGHAFVEAYLNQQDPYDKIVSRIKTTLPTLDAELTQWTTDQEFDRDTCDYRITVKHRFDPSIEMAEKVYPFNAAKKLYRAKNRAGAFEYVKAACGGTHILDEWNGKKDDECWMIDNPPKEKIATEDNQTILPYNSVQFVLLRRYYSSNFFADCIPLVDTKIAITADGKLIKIIEKPHQEAGTGENTSFISSRYGNILRSYNESVFFQATTLQDLELKVGNIWHLTVPKYKGWSGVGAAQCPLEKATISYQFTKDDLDSILK